jgi:dTDP-4-amino-4,6-dideoxygalactose transaminase
MSISDTVRHSSSDVVFESYSEVGFNYRMTDIQAAVGREQLKRLPEILRRRRELAVAYQRALSEVAALTLPSEPHWARSNWQSFCVRLTEECDQKQVMQALLDLGIASRRGIMCAHREPAYRKQPWRSAGDLVISEQAQDKSLILPLYPQMSQADQERVNEAIRSVLMPVPVC